MPNIVDGKTNYIERVQQMYQEFTNFVEDNKYEPFAIMPLKLFRLDLVPVNRMSWQKIYNHSTKQWGLPNELKDITFVQSQQETIERVINEIKMLYILPREKQIEKLNELYPCKLQEEDELSDNIYDILAQGFNKKE
tara:strand:- start:2237 stop:2647 length:411 start_codon:yes stop_codon:yes gene_type:complete